MYIVTVFKSGKAKLYRFRRKAKAHKLAKRALDRGRAVRVLKQIRWAT